MNPILLYPQNAADAKFFRETAENRGTKITKLSKEFWEELEDMLFFKEMAAAETDVLVSEEEYKKVIARKLAGK